MKKKLILTSALAVVILGIATIVFIQRNLRPGSLFATTENTLVAQRPESPLPQSTSPSMPAASISPSSSPTAVTPSPASQTPLAEAAVPTQTVNLPIVEGPGTLTPTPKPTNTATATTTGSPIYETFEGSETSWKVTRESAGGGSVARSSTFALDGSYSALMTTGASGAKAQLRIAYSESAASHAWNERPGTWFWQRASVYIPAGTVQQLGASDYLTLAGLYPSAGGTYGWWLRLRQGGALYVYGYDANGAGVEFRVYGTFPTGQWNEVSLGLHTQNGSGVKRAFALLINGNFYGWYHQGHLANETYDRAVFGILDTNSSKTLQVYVDSWRNSSTGQFPDGPDNRSTASMQEQDFRLLSGVQWQIDWSTWQNNLRLDATHGLYSATDRLQSGRNLDRMPDLTSGWAEIEVDWSGSTPSTSPSGYFGPMVGFRKEINREENFEIIPIGRTGGAVDLVLEAWVNGGPIEKARWALPDDNGNNIHIPAPGDIIRVKWQQVNTTQMTVLASYFDASKNVWNQNIINLTLDVSNIGGVNFNDGFHKASSVTIDTSQYSIRRYKVGTIDTAP